MQEEMIFNIKLFEFEDGDVCEEGYNYFNVKWLIPELKKFNGYSVTLNQNQDVQIWDEKAKKIKEFNLIDIEGFKELLKEVFYRQK